MLTVTQVKMTTTELRTTPNADDMTRLDVARITARMNVGYFPAFIYMVVMFLFQGWAIQLITLSMLENGIWTFHFDCSVAGASCAGGGLSMNSKCYRKFVSLVTWFTASNDCLLHAESLAVFTDVERSSLKASLSDWLDTDKTYWIGLVRSWWNTTDEGCICVASFWLTTTFCF